jgi:hypothetical protein
LIPPARCVGGLLGTEVQLGVPGVSEDFGGEFDQGPQRGLALVGDDFGAGLGVVER